MSNPNWHEEKTYESMMTYGLHAIKFVLIANGGAIIAMLTFLGNNTDKIQGLRTALYYYVGGIVIGGLVNITAYATQFYLFNEPEIGHVPTMKNHITWLRITLVLLTAGIGVFAYGSYLAATALS